MACHFEYDAGNRILRCVPRGQVSDSEVREAYVEASGHVAAFKPNAVILDTSEMKSCDASFETVRFLAGCDPPVPRGTPRYIAAPSVRVFGMARLFQIYGAEKRPDLRVVHSVAEAYRELGVTEVHYELAPRVEASLTPSATVTTDQDLSNLQQRAARIERLLMVVGHPMREQLEEDLRRLRNRIAGPESRNENHQD